MTDPDGEPSREDAFYASVLAFLKRNGFVIALLAPVVVAWLVPKGSGGVLVVLVVYLIEAIAYSAIQRRGRGIPQRGVRSGPGPGLQALWGILATLLIMGGLFGLWAVGESSPIGPSIALALGIAIIAWVWHRVSRTSGEDTSVFAARIAGTVGRAGARGAMALLIRVIVVGVLAGAGLLISILTKAFG